MGNMRLMLATETSDKSFVRFTTYMQPVLNGVRCCVIGGELRSRSMLPFANEFVQRRFSTPYLNNVDGLLVLDMGRPRATLHEETREALGVFEGEPNITFVAFDSFDPRFVKRFYNDRLAYVSNLVTHCPNPHLVVDGTRKLISMPTRRVASTTAMDMYMNEWVALGYPRGCMTRFLRQSYKQGRTSLTDGRMLLFKPEQEVERVP